MEVIYELTNETMWLSEHSTAAHIDNSRWNFTCSREVSYFQIQRHVIVCKDFITHILK